jgi:hypothetical protein
MTNRNEHIYLGRVPFFHSHRGYERRYNQWVLLKGGQKKKKEYSDKIVLLQISAGKTNGIIRLIC